MFSNVSALIRVFEGKSALFRRELAPSAPFCGWFAPVCFWNGERMLRAFRRSINDPIWRPYRRSTSVSRSFRARRGSVSNASSAPSDPFLKAVCIGVHVVYSTSGRLHITASITVSRLMNTAWGGVRARGDMRPYVCVSSWFGRAAANQT